MNKFKTAALAFMLALFTAGSAFAADMYLKNVNLLFITNPDNSTTIRQTVQVSGPSSLAGIQVDGELMVDLGDYTFYNFTGYTNKKGLVVFDLNLGYHLWQGRSASFCVQNVSRAGDVYNPAKNRDAECAGGYAP